MPFGRDLAPSMLHRHGGHAEAVARIGWCVERHALGVITGEVGAGKTVAVRAATAALDASRHVVIYLPNPSVGVRGIHHVVAALGGAPASTRHPGPAGRRSGRRERRTRTRSRRGHRRSTPDRHRPARGHQDVDEPRHGLRCPFAALLIGQPTLRQRMRLGVLAALDQRITVRYALAGMSPEETGDYIAHHGKIAGRADTLFTDDAVTLIHNASRGLPRAVNNLASTP